MKKTLSVLLSLLMVLCTVTALPLSALADTDGDFTYSVKDGKATITGYTGSDAELIIPSELGGKTVIAIGDSAFDANVTLTKVTIPEGVTAIGDSAFYDCENLIRADIPFSLTKIDGWAFKGCKSLKYAFIRGMVEAIAESTFNDCESLTAVSFPSTLSSIGENAFRNCPNLKELYFASSVDDYSDDVSIADGNDYLYGAQFAEYALAGSCGDDVYYVFNTENNVLTLKGTGKTDNYFFDYPGFYAYKDDAEVIIAEEGITVLDDGIFYGLGKVKTVLLPSTLTEIGEAAFSECVSLTGINIPRSVTIIKKQAFTDCNALTKVNVFSYNVDIKAYFTAAATIYACKGSTSETYAKDNGYEFFAVGHNWGEWEILENATEPTCTMQGNTALLGHECTICGAYETEGGLQVDALDHSLGEGVITKNPTPTETGEITFTCIDCGATETYDIAKCDKYENTLTAKGKAVKVKKGKKVTVKKAKAYTIKNAQGAVTFKKSKGNKKITVAKNGKITVKKGLKKGTYKVKIKVAATGNNSYKSKTVTVTVKIRIK